MDKNLRIVYFLRQTEASIPTFEALEETYTQMSSFLLFGSCSARFLQSMALIIKKVLNLEIVQILIENVSGFFRGTCL